MTSCLNVDNVIGR